MYEVDFIRGFAYKGAKGFVIKCDQQGLFVEDQGQKVYLTEENTILLTELMSCV